MSASSSKSSANILSMSSQTQILQISNASDGTFAAPAGISMTRNDAYYIEKIAERWAKDLTLSSALRYRLDRLPEGYAGFERARPGSAHVDRYLWGHPSGPFRSMNELYPHFKHLQDAGSSVGCSCKLCRSGSGQKVSSIDGSATSEFSTDGSKHFPQRSAAVRRDGSSASKVHRKVRGIDPSYDHGTQKNEVRPRRISTKANIQRNTTSTHSQKGGIPHPMGLISVDQGYGGLPEGRYDVDDGTDTPRGKQTDDEGTQDIYRDLLDKLKVDGSVDEPILDNVSPDWRTSHEQIEELIKEWQVLPTYVPRMGELVLFARTENPLAWDVTAQTFRHFDAETKSWLSRPQWEAGLITQMPMQPHFKPDEDLKGIRGEQTHSITFFGFRIEPMASLNDAKKPLLSVQHKYVPLHMIRPLSLFKECTQGLPESEVHPTLQNALMVSSSFCLLSRFHFKGIWPEATIFARGVFVGAELMTVGDTVRLTPQQLGPKPSVMTEIMVISSIRLLLVNLDQTNDDDYDAHQPYTSCLHIRGKAFTLDPARSFDGMGKCVARPGTDIRPDLSGYGTWYHMTDPHNAKSTLEIPFTRLMGRCYSFAAMQTWFDGILSSSTAFFTSINLPAYEWKPTTEPSISIGLAGLVESRSHSTEHDKRIDRANGKSWYWADSRIEQLDLCEVNGRFVGIKDATRDRAQMNAWRQALKVLDGKKGGLEEYHAARMRRQEEERSRLVSASSGSAWGIVASAQAQVDSASASGLEKSEESEESGGMEIEGTKDEGPQTSEQSVQ